MIEDKNNILPIVDVIRLLDYREPMLSVDEVSSGYYPRDNASLVLHNCDEVRGNLIYGYSKKMREDVLVEKEFLRPLISESDLLPFSKEVRSMKDDMLIVTVPRMESERGQLLINYLRKCHLKDVYRDDRLIFGEHLLSPKLDFFCNSKKIVLSPAIGGSVAAWDNDGYTIPKVGLYAIRPLETEMISPLLMIYNSRWFPCYVNAAIHMYNLRSNAMHETLTMMPMPNGDLLYDYMDVIDGLVDMMTHVRTVEARLYDYDELEMFWDYMQDIIDQVVFELYYPSYMYSRQMDVLMELRNSPFVVLSPKESNFIYECLKWLLRPDNRVRQKLMLLDTRSRDFLYRIHQSVKK